MTDTYRALEVILGMEWSSKVDIWFIGVMVSELHHLDVPAFVSRVNK